MNFLFLKADLYYILLRIKFVQNGFFFSFLIYRTTPVKTSVNADVIGSEPYTWASYEERKENIGWGRASLARANNENEKVGIKIEVWSECKNQKCIYALILFSFIFCPQINRHSYGCIFFKIFSLPIINILF